MSVLLWSSFHLFDSLKGSWGPSWIPGNHHFTFYTLEYINSQLTLIKLPKNFARLHYLRGKYCLRRKKNVSTAQFSSVQSLSRVRLFATPWIAARKPLDESEREEWKSWLTAQHSENEDHGIWSHHFMGNRWGNSVRLYFIGLQNHCRWWLQPWN